MRNRTQHYGSLLIFRPPRGTMVLWPKRRKDNGGMSISTGPSGTDSMRPSPSARGYCSKTTATELQRNLSAVTPLQTVISLLQ
jgi:hypothetical protein